MGVCRQQKMQQGAVISVLVVTGETSQYTAEVQVEEGITCHDVVQDIVARLQLPERSGKGAWHIYEHWKGIERVVSSTEELLSLCGVRDDIILIMRQGTTNRQHRIMKRHNRQKKPHPSSLHSSHRHTSRFTSKQLRYLHWSSRRVLRHYRKRYSSILLKRLATRNPLRGALDTSPLDLLQGELKSLRESNLQLSVEIADSNIISTRLRNQLNPLRQKAQTLSVQFDELQEEVRNKREEKERRGPRDMAQAQTELIRLRRELEMRNRLNAGQNSKMKVQKEMLAEKKKLLADKKQELERLKSGYKSHMTSHVTPEKTPDKTKLTLSDKTPPPRTPPSSRKEHRSSSAAKRRHSRIFEEKTRQLVEEEGQAFRKLQSQLKQVETKKKLDFSLTEEDRELFKSSGLDTYVKSALDIQTEGPDVLRIPKEDTEWYLSPAQDTHTRVGVEETDFGRQESTGETAKDGSGLLPWKPKVRGIVKKPSSQSRPHRNVKFTADAVLLDAALEGELELLKHCIEQLGSYTLTSEKGATCLHNGVCSGNMEVVRYLVELGADVNCQDVEGWTPLHCAVAYSNSDITRYLVENGASLYLTTKDGDTPLKIGTEEYEIQRGNMSTDGGAGQEEESGCQATVECLHYLMDLHSNLGISNDAIVYALFSRDSTDPDDLKLVEGEQLKIIDRGGRGEQWWLAENTRRERGMVPCTFLGPFKNPRGSTL